MKYIATLVPDVIHNSIGVNTLTKAIAYLYWNHQVKYSSRSKPHDISGGTRDFVGEVRIKWQAEKTMKECKGKSLKEDYFPKAMAIVKEYDGKVLGQFKVIKKTGGEINPQMIAIFEWPDIATKERMMSDPRYKEIKPIRDAALSFLKLGYYEVSKDTTITFKEDKVYEFFGAWIDSKDKLDEYFKVSGPIKKNYGRPEPIFKTMLGVMKDAPNGSQTYRPQMVGIVEWDQSDDFYILTKNKDFKKKAKPLFEAAVARIDMLHTKIMINPPEKVTKN